MAGRGGYSVVIEAVDNASKKIDAINKRIAQMQAPIDRLQKSLTKFADLTGITKISNGIRGLGDRALHAFQAIARIIEPLAAITGAASIAGMVRLTTLWADFGSKLGFAAQRIGIASDQLQALQGAARLAGSSSEAMTNGMRTLGDNMVNAVGGRAPEVVMMMNTLGLSFRNADGSARKAADVLPELADKLAKIQNPTLRARAATALLGGAAEDLLPFLARGAAGLEEYRQKALKYGVINEKGVAAARKMQEAQTGLKMAIEGLGNSIAEKLEPVLGPLMTHFGDLIAANRELIATKIGEWAAKLRDYLQSIDWTRLINGMRSFGEAAGWIYDKLGGLQGIADKFLAYMITKWTVQMVACLAKVEMAIAVGLTGSMEKAEAAAMALNARLASNPAIRTLMILAQLYEKVQGTDVPQTQQQYDDQMRAMPPDSPLWRGIPDDTQKKYPNSPYSQRPHGAPSAPPSSAADIKMTPSRRAFLDTLAGPESGGQYDIKNGWSPKNDNSQTRFKDFSRFPEGIAPGGTSSAAGRYQFISGTWKSEQQKLGLPDFSPASQDKAAWDLAATAYRARTNRDLDADWRDGHHQSDIATALRSIWPSLPGGSQSHQSQDTFDRARAVNLAREGGPPVNIAGGSGSPAAAQDVNLKGGAAIKVTLAGIADRAAQITTNTFGNVFSGSPQVAFAMPMAGP